MASHSSQPGAPGRMHLVDLIRSTVPPMNPAGRPFVGASLAVGIGLRFLLRRVGLRRLGGGVGRLGWLGAAACAAFFREPHRVTPPENELVVAPADGTVALIEPAAPPAELGLGDTPRTRISIFLSVFDVHVQRAPVTGVVTQVAYRAGKFLSADLDKASVDNERNSIVIKAVAGQSVVVTQIAGLVARRIVCDTAVGKQVVAGGTYGLIRFGSRVDTYLPDGAKALVRVGQRTIGGETPLAALPRLTQAEAEAGTIDAEVTAHAQAKTAAEATAGAGTGSGEA